VSSSSEEGPLSALVRPIRFALKDGGKNLGVVKGLEGTLLKILLAMKDAPVGPRPELGMLERLARGLDALSPPEKKTRLEAMLGILGEKRERAPAPEPGPAEAPEPPPKRRATKKIEQAATKVEAKPARQKRIPIGAAEPDDQLASLVGVGPKTAERFAERGLQTVADALYFLPRRFEDRSRLLKVQELVPGQAGTLVGEVRAHSVRPMGKGRRVFELAVADETGTVSVRFFRFHQTHLEGRYPRGTKVVVSGPVTAFGAMRQMIHPDLERLEPDEVPEPGGILAIYGEIEGVPAKTVRRILSELAELAPKLPDPLPPELRARHGLPPLAEVIGQAHRPAKLDGSHQKAVERRLVFDELFYLQVALLSKQRSIDLVPGVAHQVPPAWEQAQHQVLPFTLTGAQRRALLEIESELAAPRPMHRLLLGDVGSGKTAVAFLSALYVQKAGRQTALLVPTEILAAQHQKNAERLLAAQGLRIALLTGSTKTAERRSLLARLAAGEIDLLIGTHALLEPNVVFQDLGLVIIDEQHRFGVEQRATLMNKRQPERPDVLVMTATPIPRTLALTAYGDLRVTVIDERPAGRAPTTTRLYDGRRIEEAYQVIEAELAAGRQAYVVYPLVETSEKLDLSAATEARAELEERFAPRRVGLLHGRLAPEEKAQVMAEFVRGELPILVSTTVIEVGVDVENASVMLVADADRFGLSQIHQLRGRVGRGRFPGHCLLVSRNRSPEARARLLVLRDSEDGFQIAEQDLAQRGPGEILGTRQSGLPDLVLADLVRDAGVLEVARRAAEQLLLQDPELEAPAHRPMRIELERRFRDRAALLRVG
jgi:ATP-dependent DNA helicase RecG